jgi:hypothetical protein
MVRNHQPILGEAGEADAEAGSQKGWITKGMNMTGRRDPLSRLLRKGGVR